MLKNYEENEIMFDEYKEEFIVDTDIKAEWCLKKIAVEKAEAKRYIDVCNEAIRRYQEKINKKNEQLETSVWVLTSKLMNYFDGVEHKKTRTQESYKLPSGTLKIKFSTPQFIQDVEVLRKWVKANAPKRIKTVESVEWGELKKDLTVDGENAITKDGEIVDGIKVEYTEPKFVVETEDM